MFLLYRRSMNWREEHCVMLIREILLYEPWKYKHGSVERGQVWKRNAESLCALEEPIFRVDDRSVRDKYNLLVKKFRKKENSERRESGIAPEEESEVDKGLRDIIEQFEESYNIHQADTFAKTQKMENETAEAEELRQASLESFGETQKKKSLDEDEETVDKRRKRSTGSETITYLREKGNVEAELRKQELDLRRKELETQAQSQQQIQSLMQQQQQMDSVMLQVLSKFLPQ